MVINGKALLELAPIKDMLETKETIHGRSYGLAEVGYDIRLKQTVRFSPTIWDFDGDGLVIPNSVTVDGNYIPRTNFCLASAIEEFDMPPNLMGVVHDKSTNIREGIQVFNSIIEPHWQGFLTVEIAFHGNRPITLEAGTPIAQVVFHELQEKAYYEGKYQNQEDKPVNSIYE